MMDVFGFESVIPLLGDDKDGVFTIVMFLVTYCFQCNGARLPLENVRTVLDLWMNTFSRVKCSDGLFQRAVDVLLSRYRTALSSTVFAIVVSPKLAVVRKNRQLPYLENGTLHHVDMFSPLLRPIENPLLKYIGCSAKFDVKKISTQYSLDLFEHTGSNSNVLRACPNICFNCLCTDGENEFVCLGLQSYLDPAVQKFFLPILQTIVAGKNPCNRHHGITGKMVACGHYHNTYRTPSGVDSCVFPVADFPTIGSHQMLYTGVQNIAHYLYANAVKVFPTFEWRGLPTKKEHSFAGTKCNLLAVSHRYQSSVHIDAGDCSLACGLWLVASGNVRAYLCFPTLGIRIPLLPGTFVVFNSLIEHCTVILGDNRDIYGAALQTTSQVVLEDWKEVQVLSTEWKSM